MATTQDIEAGVKPGGIGPIDYTGPPQPLDLPPYYVAAPGMPSQPPPVEQPQVVDRQAYWLQQAETRRQEEEFRQQALAAQRQPQYDPFLDPRLPEWQRRNLAPDPGALDTARRLTQPPLQGPLPTTPEFDRLSALDYGSPTGEPPFPGYERGARATASAAGAVGGLVGQEQAGRTVGEFAYRSIVPGTPAELVAFVLTGGAAGETTAVGRAIRNTALAQAKKAGLRLEEYAATKEGKAFLTKLSGERGEMRLPGGEEPVPPEPAAGAEGAAGGLPASAADNLPPPPEPQIPGGLLSEQGDVIAITKKAEKQPYALDPLLRHYPEQQLAPEAANLDKPVIGEAPAPRLQPALGLLDEQGQIIDPLDPTATLVRQAFGGEAPVLPPDVSIPGVQEWRRTWSEFATQLADSRAALNSAIERRKQLSALYESPEQRAIRTAQKAATKQGLTGDTSNALAKSELDDARAAVRAAQKANDAAKEAMKAAHIRVVDEDIARRLDAVGVDEKVIKDVQTQFEISQTQQQGEADFLTMPGMRKRIEQVYNRLAGNLSGPVGHSAARAMNLNSGLNVWVNDFAKNYLKPMQRQLDQVADKLRFVGDRRYAGLADTHRLWYVFTHPEDFRGFTPEMHKLLNQAEQEGRAFYQGVRQFDPLNTAKPVGGRYLPQMWEDGIDYVERFGHARGKAFITKQRAWKDWREAILSDAWSKELAEMPPGQALEYAHRAAAQQMSDFYMRRDVLRQFGSRTQRAGDVAFNAPMYRGWYAKPEIVSQVDAYFQPAADFIRPAGKVLQPIKNVRYGIDFAIWGYNVLHTLAGGNVQIAAGLLERALHGTGLRTIGEFADEGLMIQHGLAARGLESPFHKGGATPLSWIPPLRGIDSKLTQGLDWLQRTQYSNIMGPLRHLVAQGNVAIERATGELTPAKMGRAMDNANAVTGTSRGAQRVGRAQAESILLGSARITRSQVATLGQLIKIGTPETIATLASYGVTIGAVGLALDRVFGDGRGYTFSPFSLKDGKLEYNSEWATVSIKGRRYSLIPQAALARAIAKSMAAAGQMDPNAFSTAWAQYGYTRVTPGAQGAISATTGAGFAPGKPFSPFGGLNLKQRALALAPIPVAGTSQLESSQRGLRPGIESTVGLTSYSSVPSASQEKSAAKLQALAPLAKVGFHDIVPDTWKDNLAALRSAIPTRALSKPLDQFANIEDAKKDYLEPPPGEHPTRTQIDARAARFEALPAVKAYKQMIKTREVYILRKVSHADVQAAYDAGVLDLDKEQRAALGIK